MQGTLIASRSAASGCRPALAMTLLGGAVPVPREIIIERENFRRHLPVTTSIIISQGVALILWLLRK